MDITYLGHSSFKLKGKEAVVVTDPFKPDAIGLKYPKVEADIVTVSRDFADHNYTTAIEGAPFIVNYPGEYEVKGVSIFGYVLPDGGSGLAENKSNTIFVIQIEGINICHLGDINTKPPEKIIEEINVADILLVPVGGITTIGPEEATEIIKALEPSIVIPMHYRTAGMIDTFDKFAPVEQFSKAMGLENSEKLDKLVVFKDKLPEEMKVVLLERKS